MSLKEMDQVQEIWPWTRQKVKATDSILNIWYTLDLGY